MKYILIIVLGYIILMHLNKRAQKNNSSPEKKSQKNDRVKEKNKVQPKKSERGDQVDKRKKSRRTETKNE